MADFTSNFWSYFIIVLTSISIIACFVLIHFFKKGKTTTPDDEKETTGHIWDEDLSELNNPLPVWWLNLFYITLVFGIIYLFLYPGMGSFKGYLGWSQIKQYNDEIQLANEKYSPIFDKYANQDLISVASDPEALEVGKRLYSAYCTTCHGSDAGGARGFPNLRDNDWLYGGDPETIKTTILNGRSGMMPAWGKAIDEEGIFNVTEYLRYLNGRKVNESKSDQGKKIFSTFCAVCHGPEGKGNQEIGAPDLTNEIWLHGGSTKRIIETITNGRINKMPPHKEFLGEAKAHLLAAYVYSLSNNK